MGIFSKIFSKEACALCGTEAGVLSRTKLKDGNYVCSNCTSQCSAYFQAVRYDLEEFKKHLEHMERENELYEKEFATLPNENKESCIRNFSTGIVFADDIGMFEIINSKTKLKKKKELFRYDQIWDFKMYSKPAPEGSSHKYAETGVKIKLLSKSDNDPVYVIAGEEINNCRHPYIFDELEVWCASSVDNLEGGLVRKHLERILGLALETSISIQYPNTERTSYRSLDEVQRTFNRRKYTEIADEAERRVFGKTLRELEK